MGIKEQLEDLEDKIAKGLEGAHKKMTTFKQQNNSPIIISKDGKVVEIKVENTPPTITGKNS